MLQVKSFTDVSHLVTKQHHWDAHLGVFDSKARVALTKVLKSARVGSQSDHRTSLPHSCSVADSAVFFPVGHQMKRFPSVRGSVVWVV